jgi:hypothetical protein
LVALAGVGSAAPPAEPHSLIVVRWLSQHIVETPCPEPAICAGEIVDARLVVVETLAGPVVPTQPTVRMMSLRLDAPAQDYRAILIVRPGGNGVPWVGRLIGSAVPGRDSCIRSDLFVQFAIRPPPRAYRRSEQTCIPAA